MRVLFIFFVKKRFSQKMDENNNEQEDAALIKTIKLKPIVCRTPIPGHMLKDMIYYERMNKYGQATIERYSPALSRHFKQVAQTERERILRRAKEKKLTENQTDIPMPKSFEQVYHVDVRCTPKRSTDAGNVILQYLLRTIT